MGETPIEETDLGALRDFEGRDLERSWIPKTPLEGEDPDLGYQGPLEETYQGPL